MIVKAAKALLEGFLLRSLDERPVGLHNLEYMNDEDALAAIARPTSRNTSTPLSTSVDRITRQIGRQPAPAFSRAPNFTYRYSQFSSKRVFTTAGR
ncbi:MAG: hypothetical protein KC476_00500 [Cyanobacteria bacterium HKST-UBA06]|nr:hypothetical protein [Cyanobacteria bacterium HKST-UBA05]MCA9798557.1 hypothetical protein [Cyanobacteria bacterium HKST-UBA04]MCA9806408.1 hypothetical protein [Cyanobacteria bacterium HKST-UBA06]MCA9841510.1 hypothetical protein [Cyanobacteria bacterium HKST-UBA03]